MRPSVLANCSRTSIISARNAASSINVRSARPVEDQHPNTCLPIGLLLMLSTADRPCGPCCSGRHGADGDSRVGLAKPSSVGHAAAVDDEDVEISPPYTTSRGLSTRGQRDSALEVSQAGRTGAGGIPPAARAVASHSVISRYRSPPSGTGLPALQRSRFSQQHLVHQLGPLAWGPMRSRGESCR